MSLRGQFSTYRSSLLGHAVPVKYLLMKKIYFVVFLSSQLGLAAALAPGLGTQKRLHQLRAQNRTRMCGDLLSSASGGKVHLPLTRGLVDMQLQFSSDFLRYSETDIEQGIYHALISYFPSSRALLSDEVIPPEKVNPASISFKLRRRGHREADRTLQSIVLLQKIIRGESVDAFGTSIKPLNPSQANITFIRQVVMDYLTDTPGVPLDKNVFKKVKVEKLHAMIVRLIFHDQGKFKSVMDEYRIRKQEQQAEPVVLSADHDAIMHDILKDFAGSMAPEHLGVYEQGQAVMAKTDELAINPGRAFQFEAPAHHIKGLAKLDEEAFMFWWIKEVMDVGGAQASTHPNGSFWIKPVIANYEKLYNDRARLRGVDESAIVDYYNQLLKDSAQQLGLKTDTPKEKAVAKLALLFRLNQIPKTMEGADAGFNPQKRRIDAMVKQFSALSAEKQQNLIAALNRTGIGDGVAFTFGYVPEMSYQIMTKRGVGTQTSIEAERAVSDQQIESAVGAGLTMFDRVLGLANYHLGAGDQLKAPSGEFTLEMPQLADLVKTQGPDALLGAQLNFKFAGDGSAEITATPQ